MERNRNVQIIINIGAVEDTCSVCRFQSSDAKHCDMFGKYLVNDAKGFVYRCKECLEATFAVAGQGDY